MESHALPANRLGSAAETPNVASGVVIVSGSIDTPSGGPAGDGRSGVVAPHPQRIGDYRIVRQLGAGGMGEVYVARHLFFGRDEVLKRIVKFRFSDDARRQFGREMATLAAMNDPNIVRIHYAGTDDSGFPYFVMEYVAGGDLGQWVKSRKTPAGGYRAPHPADAARLVKEVAKAVAHAHAQRVIPDGEGGHHVGPEPALSRDTEAGVIHCDIKPQNVLLRSPVAGRPLADAGSPVLADFGLARAAGRAGGPAQFGTPGYMPPEQAAGDPTRVDERSDVFGLGAVLYELLAGRPPFPGDTRDARLALTTNRKYWPKLADGLQAAPPTLAAICLRCLAYDPGERYPSAAAAADALREYLRPCWFRRRWKWAAAAAVIGTLTGYIAVANVQRHAAARAAAVERWASAEAALAGRDLPQAAFEYRRLLDSGDDTARAKTNLVQALVGLAETGLDARQWGEADGHLKEAERLLEGERTLARADVHHFRGRYYTALEKWPAALDEWTVERDLRGGIRADAHPNSARCYGFLGDAERMTGRSAHAQASYEEAQKLRAKLLAENECPATRCMSARDDGNLAVLADWKGNADEARKHRRDRLATLRPLPLANALPDEHRTERADAKLQVVEIELDLTDGPGPADLPALLAEAAAEFDVLRAGTKETDAPLTIRPGCGYARLARGRYAARTGRAAEALEHLRQACLILETIDAAAKATPSDYYNWAAALALLATLEADPAARGRHEVLALDRLRGAAVRNYAEVHRLARDPAFRPLANASDYQSVQNVIQKNHDRHNKSPEAPR